MNQDLIARQCRKLTRWAERTDEVGVGAVHQIRQGQIPGSVPGLPAHQRTIPEPARMQALKLLARHAGKLSPETVKRLAEYPRLWIELGRRDMTTSRACSVASRCWQPIETLFQEGEGKRQTVVAGVRGLGACMDQSSFWLEVEREEQVKRWIEQYRLLGTGREAGRRGWGAEGLWRHLAGRMEWEAQTCYRLYRQWKNHPQARLEVCRLQRGGTEDLKFWNGILAEPQIPEPVRQFGQTQQAVHRGVRT